VPILVVGAALRLPQLDTVPGWYPDEGSNIAIAASLAQGDLSYLAFEDSYFISGRMPIVCYEMALLFRCLGIDILWARLVTAVLGLVTLLILFLVSDRVAGRAVALSAAAFYAVYPGAVALSRMAFTYNHLAPLALLALYGLWRVQEDSGQRWVFLSACCTGLALLTDVAAVSLLVFFVVALVFLRPRALVWSLPLSLFPLLAWGLTMWLSAGAHFLYDVRFTLQRTSPSLSVQMVRVLFYRTALEGDVWLAFGGVGLLTAGERRQRRLFGGFYWVALIVLAQNSPLYGQASYFLVPLFPLAAWGIGTLAVRWIPVLLREVEQCATGALKWFPLSHRVRKASVIALTSGVLFLLLAAPLVTMAAEGVWMGHALYLSRFGSTLADPSTARKAAAYVNAYTDRKDVVLTSPTIAWLVDARAADFQMAVAATGRATQHFPAGIPEQRFRFDPRLEDAAYVILDPVWRGWAAGQMSEVARMVEEVEGAWSLEVAFGDFYVYRNPQHGLRDSG
jgi:4-amino-4-deoxy-L-arabinose transferase-like glycosyltransferase